MILTKTIQKNLLILLLTITPLTSFAYNLRQISVKDGLSNSAIRCIFQDKDGYMWLGTYDGLNKYDGINIDIYKPTGQANSITGNIIRNIIETEKGTLWIQTTSGLNKLNKITQQIDHFSQITGHYAITSNKNNEFFAIYTNDSIALYSPGSGQFKQYYVEGIRNEEIVHLSIDNNHVAWIFSVHGIAKRYNIITKDGTIQSVKNLPDYPHKSHITSVSLDNEYVYFVDKDKDLFAFNRITGDKEFIQNIRSEMDQYGVITKIIRDRQDFFISFANSGVIRLFPGKPSGHDDKVYHIEKINLNCGVFSLCKDKNQDIIWIGTDGQGVFMYSRDSYSFRTTTFNQLQNSIQKPVRSIFLDKENNLWLGTKGDDIVKFPNYQVGENLSQKKQEHIIKNENGLVSNSIFAFSESKTHPLLWIAGDGPGMNYYSYTDKKIHTLKNSIEKNIVFTHSILETDDSTLWLASSGNGLQKVNLTFNGNQPQVSDLKEFYFFRPINNYYSVIAENDSILWIGSRGNGAVRFNRLTETWKNIKLADGDNQILNDILSIHKDESGTIWFGTSFGLNKLISYHEDSVKFRNYNENNGLPNNTIHGILEDERGYLWLSTNKGIVEFNPRKESFRVYNHKDGIDVIEFSDNAYFESEDVKSLFFGGTNGFIVITQDKFEESPFSPHFYFYGLKIFGNEKNLNGFMKNNKQEEFLELKYNDNFFSISFIALDYINGRNYTYEYKLENFSDQWINNGNNNTVTFTNITPGEYILHVKYKNGMLNVPEQTYSLHIVILPPWYQTSWAYLIYFLCILLIIFFTVKIIMKRYRQKREIMLDKMNQQQKEEIYESKLRFFTNITHELCTPLTLIYGPCNRIISYQGSDAFIKKYALLIQRNAEKLNALIQELIEFRRLETGNKATEIESLLISEVSKNIADSFSELSESKDIDYNINIEDNITWPSDRSCFTKILTNLISNAFKYTPEKGNINVNIQLKENELIISVSNSGRGIKKEDIPLIFDRYRVLDNLEKQSEKGLMSQNGLGLAICHNMVKLLNGGIEVNSIPEESTEFKVILPLLKVNTISREKIEEEPPFIVKFDNEIPVIDIEKYEFQQSRPTILIIDDDPEMLWFVSEIFTEQYNIIPIEDPVTVMDTLYQRQPDLIISDIMMPKLDGIQLTRQIKADKKFSHIPLILLSAKNSTEEQVEGIESGAEMYLTKPFNIDYFKSVVDRLIQRKEVLKDYYNSPLSSFELLDNRLIHKEDKEFFEKITAIIDKNINNPELSTELLASSLGLSTRHLYRRLKSITDKTPADLIKEYRLKIVERLLITTNISIDEIIYKAGFSNRGNFFKIFSQKYGTTPKNFREKLKMKN